ncbi:MAG: CidA/LrgA family protein [Lachnospiraceae bacterium]|jgi:holin-like protein|nr:CidA/LrgA family protein [Lachnospiraceae bacterium]MDD3616237.1 CidA/LrgA family protein [Lachnospiraceae bacterium]
MKFMQQFGIILGITFVGEVLKELIPLPIPASIYGLVLMLLCLQTGIVKLKSVEESGNFLIEIMPLMFIPAAVGLMESFEQLRPILFSVVFVTAATTIIVMVVTGRVTQYILRREENSSEGNIE